MKTSLYTEEMTKLAILAAAAAIALALLIPYNAHAKAKGDTIGAPKKEIITGTTRADLADVPMPPAYFYSAVVATPIMITESKATTTTNEAEIAQMRAQLKQLRAQLELLEKQINALSK